MKLDETLESVGRLWEQVSVIVVLHALFFALAVLAGIIPTSDLTHLESLIPASTLERFRSDLRTIGLELPLVAGLLLVGLESREARASSRILDPCVRIVHLGFRGTSRTPMAPSCRWMLSASTSLR